MTVTFNWLRTREKELPSEAALGVLQETYSHLFTGWVEYHRLLYPSLSLDEYLINLPASIIDEILAHLKGLKL